MAALPTFVVQNKVIGAFLFTLGLTTIFLLDAKLYTGFVGHTVVKHRQHWLRTLVIALVGNLIGTLALSTLTPLMSNTGDVIGQIQDVWQTKTNVTPLSAFLSSSCCGFLLYGAWRANQNDKSTYVLFVTVLSVMTFIVMGFDHSIANSFMMFTARDFTPEAFGYLVLMILGNTAGSTVGELLFTLHN